MKKIFLIFLCYCVILNAQTNVPAPNSVTVNVTVNTVISNGHISLPEGIKSNDWKMIVIQTNNILGLSMTNNTEDAMIQREMLNQRRKAAFDSFIKKQYP